MPDIWTHILCGSDTIDSLSDTDWKSTILENKTIFYLGCQGPDIFLYNDFWPWIKKKRGLSIGQRMHVEKTGEFFTESLKYLRDNINGEENLKIIFTYIAGFACHFGLDRNAHPYIHYYAGKYDRAICETHKYRGYHKKLELIIDTIMLYEKRNIKSYQYPVFEKIDAGKILPKTIISFYNHILHKLYSNDTIDYINDSYRDMIKVQKIIYDPHGLKGTLLNIVDKIFRGEIDYSGVVYPRFVDDKKDYMNRNHNLWNHPCNKTEVYTESFDDLYSRAIIQNEKMINGVIDFLEYKIEEEQLKRVFPNISYSTGKPTNEKCELMYYNPIFD